MAEDVLPVPIVPVIKTFWKRPFSEICTGKFFDKPINNESSSVFELFFKVFGFFISRNKDERILKNLLNKIKKDKKDVIK